MIDIEVTGTQVALDYFERIVHQLQTLFRITRDEAAGRLNRFWEGQDFSGEMDVNLLRHESPTYWAKTIYYGPEARWWKGEDGLQPQPYP